MALSEHLAAMGGNVRPGDKIAEALSARRVNGLMNAVQELAKGENLSGGPGILVRRNTTGVIISAAPAPRTNSTVRAPILVEIALDADTAPTSAQIDAALVAFYADDTVPREGDTFRISRADTHYPEVEVKLTKTELGPDWRFSPNAAVTIQEKPWYKITRDISGRVYFEGTASKTTADEGGVEVTNKTDTKTLLIEPAEITADMRIRDLPVVVGSEIKIARVVASEPVSQDPVVNLPGGQEFLEGGGIRFLESETDAEYITVYLPEIAAIADQDEGTLIKLEYVPATLPGGAEGVRLKYSSRIVDNSESKVRLLTDDVGVTWYFNLDEATLELIEGVAEYEDRIAALEDRMDSLEEDVGIIDTTQNSMLTTMGAMGAAVDALQSDVVTLDGRADNLEGRAGLLEENQGEIFDLLIDHGTTLDDHIDRLASVEEDVGSINTAQDDMLATMLAMATAVDELVAAVGGATIECDESGVTLTWGGGEEP